MVLCHASPARLEIRRSGGFGATVLSAIALGAFALAPLLSGGAVTSGRALLAFVLGLVAGLLAIVARPRARGLRILLDAGVIDDDQGTARALARARGITLTSGGSTLEHAARARYRAELELDAGERLVLLEDPDPARVLADLRRVLGYVNLPVRPGWGLGDDRTPWRTAPPRRTETPRVSIRGKPQEAERGAGICVAGGALVIGTAMGIMHVARIRSGADTSLLSWVLSLSLFGFVVVLAAFLLSDVVVVEIGPDRLRVERHALGLTLSRFEVAAAEIRGATAVGLVPGEPRHLVLETRAGFRSFSLVGEAATRAAAALDGA